MHRYTVNFNDGRLITVLGTISDAKNVAITQMKRNKRDTHIELDDGEIVTRARWRKGRPNRKDCAINVYWLGFHELWSDEL